MRQRYARRHGRAGVRDGSGSGAHRDDAYQLDSDAGRAYLDAIPKLFAANVNVPPTLAARLSVEIGSGRFDRLAGRMLMAARGDLDLDEAAIRAIVAADLRALRVNGLPPDAARAALRQSEWSALRAGASRRAKPGGWGTASRAEAFERLRAGACVLDNRGRF